MRLYLVADSEFMKLRGALRQQHLLFTKFGYSRKAFAWAAERRDRREKVDPVYGYDNNPGGQQ